ncbi:MAG TPA: transcription termination/antitermination protein NusG [Candidatus Methylomirabilis sp.]|nr:transcription termination/antitermination protein NusG [Candidatus Methylomirabilis sp.]HSB80779.1 transcription termination/antitermination protein NusG [Candidatus Methylomirabilis sp.]
MGENEGQAVVAPPRAPEEHPVAGGAGIPEVVAGGPAAASPPLPPHHKWYVIHTYSGFENKVKQSIEQRVAALGLHDAVSQVMIPIETVVELKKGKKREASRKFFPGYVLVRMDMTDDLWYLIKNTPKVTGFVGPGVRPTPIPDEQVKAVIQQVETGAERPKHKVLFTRGESVRVIDGPFSNFTGVVDEVKPDKGRLKVMVSIFGRPTPVDLEFLQVERV